MLEHTTLGSLDIAFFGASLAVTVLIGLYFANKNKTFADYARGGGNQNIWAVSASMAAGYCSALTLIGNPSELYMHGTSFTLTMATTIIAWPISSFVFLPVFKRLDGISIFQYIELRFNPWLRRFVSLLFIFQMTFYSAISLYLPSLPLYATLKIPQFVSVGLIGLICIVYCSFGGIKAVTWTNFYHTILLIFTMIAIIIAGTIKSGGITRVLVDAFDEGRLSLGQDYFQFDLTTRHTIYNTIFGYTMIRLFLHGTSQMQVQSALSLSTFRKSQASQLISAVFYFIIQIIASAIGLILYVNYEDCDPYLSGEIQRQDELLMHYINKNLSSIPIMQGMFIAAIFGSTLTTMSSFQSSTSAMVVEDFIKPLYLHWSRTKLDERLSAKFGKFTAIVLGTVCVLLTFEMSKISGLQQATTTLYGVIGIPILSAFALGTMTHFINTKGMFSGMLLAILFGLYVFYGHVVNRPPLEPSLPISTVNCSANVWLRQTSLPTATAAATTTTTSTSTYAPINPLKAQQLFRANHSATSQVVVGTSEDLDDLLVFDFVKQQQQQQQGDNNIEPLVEPFDVSRMSYLWLPVFTMTISVVVASIVSVLTGGLKQRINPVYLAPILVLPSKGSSPNGGDGELNGRDNSATYNDYEANRRKVKELNVATAAAAAKHGEECATVAPVALICARCCGCKCQEINLDVTKIAAPVSSLESKQHKLPGGVIIPFVSYAKKPE